MADDYRTYAATIAQNYGLNSNIFIAMLEQESGLRQYKSDGSLVVGGAGEIGIGQIKPSTAKDLGIDPYDPYQNIEGAAKYLSQHLQKTGSYDKALAAYNQGLAGSQGKGKAAGERYANQVMARVPENNMDLNDLGLNQIFAGTGLDIVAATATHWYDSGFLQGAALTLEGAQRVGTAAQSAGGSSLLDRLEAGAGNAGAVIIGVLFIGFALLSVMKTAPVIIEKVKG